MTAKRPDPVKGAREPTRARAVALLDDDDVAQLLALEDEDEDAEEDEHADRRD